MVLAHRPFWYNSFIASGQHGPRLSCGLFGRGCAAGSFGGLSSACLLYTSVQRKAQAAFPVIVGTHPRDQRTDFLLLVTGQLPGVHLRLRATMARRAGLHDQRPELLPALFFLSFALLVVTASLTRVVIVPALSLIHI